MLALCALEVALFSRSFAAFFDGDAFYYFAHQVKDAAALKPLFSSLDRAKQYRPMTYLFFSFVQYPLLGFRAEWYSLFSTGIHLLNTVLVFLLLRRLTRSDLAGMAGATFWGLNPVAIFITHSIGFLSDQLVGFFYLLATVSFLRHREALKPVYGVVSLLAFAAALLSKEIAVTLPVNLAMLTLLAFPAKSERVSAAPEAGRWVGLSLFAILFCYLLAYYNIKGGSFYDQGQADNYRFTASYAAVLSKLAALKSALYFPFHNYPMANQRMTTSASFRGRPTLGRVAPACQWRESLKTTPPFITSATRPRAATSARGSPSTAITSA